MQTSKSRLGTVLALVLVACAASLTPAAGPVHAAAPAVKYRTAEEALNQGLSGYNGGYYEIAIPALEYAAKKGSDVESFLSRYYLGRIYADNNGPHTDHARAFDIFQHLADEHAEIDSDADPRAKFVGKALVAIANYHRLGLAVLGLTPDPDRAAGYLHQAATVFGDEDAQFELAKMHLKGEGVEKNVAKAKHWLSTLSQSGHPGAQAFLADLFWRGKIVEHDPVRALALITIAVANAPQHERVWIEDIYQNIYCGTAEGVRTQATGLVADWRTRYGRRLRSETRDTLSSLDEAPERTCKDGQRVAPWNNGRYEPAGGREAAALKPASGPSERQASTSSFATGSALGGPSVGDAGRGVSSSLGGTVLGGGALSDTALGFRETGAIAPQQRGR